MDALTHDVWPYDGILVELESWFPGFDVRQEISAKHLKDVLFPSGRNRPFPVTIKRIIDAGCGEGSILYHLAKELESDAEHLAVELIGIDRATEGIERAQERARAAGPLTASRLEFAAVADEPELFRRLETEISIQPRCTALLVMGHTWFHFLDQAALRGLITRLKPAVIVVDIHTSWDGDVKDLMGGEHMVQHCINLKDDNVILLRTESEPGSDLVKRGLYAIPLDGSSAGNFVFPPTTQVKKTSEHLFGLGPDQSTLYSDRPDLAVLLNECDYISAAQIHHDSGWGLMTAHVLVSVDPIARRLNTTWADVIRGFGRKLFVEQPDGRDDDIASIQELLDFFNEVDAVAVGHRELAVILPFDPLLTFAKMTGLFPDSKDATIFQYDLLLEPPNRTQYRFPTAYSLYHTLLDIVSSPQAFTRDWAPQYKRTKIDDEYEDLEQVLLKLPNQDADFSIVPIYYASLPLFCLVLKFPKTFRPSSTSVEVYRSILRNVHDQVRIAVLQRFYLEILRPFVERFIAESVASAREATRPHADRNGFAGGLAEPQEFTAQRLDEAQAYLFGTPTIAANDVACDQLGGALNKAWKSWLLSVPSQNITTLQSVATETATLRLMWDAERKQALLDHELRLCNWFERGSFFVNDPLADGGHDYWSCNQHVLRLSSMFDVAGFRHPRPMSGTDDAWLTDALSWLESAQRDNGYFAGSSSTYLFKWMNAQLRDLFGRKGHCDAASNGCRPAQRPDCPRDKVFENLKAVFCKAQGSTGAGVRFGLHRLHCLLTAAAGRPGAVSPEPIKLFQLKRLKLEQAFWNPWDPSIAIANVVDALNVVERAPRVQIGAKRSDHDCSISVTIDFKDRLIARGGGDDCRVANEALQALQRFPVSAPAAIVNTKSISIAWRVEPHEGDGIAFVAT